MQFTTNTNTFQVSIDYPSEWHFAERPVARLVVPRQLFAVSNRPIIPTPRDSSQPRPMIQLLDPGAMFIWSYYQAPHDPSPKFSDNLPNYKRYNYPLQYRESEVFTAANAREWDGASFLWRRVGYDAPQTKLTVWIWEGTRAHPSDLAVAEQILKSVTILD